MIRGRGQVNRVGVWNLLPKILILTGAILIGILTPVVAWRVIGGLSDDTRARILCHALQLFASRGYDATGVQEIVEAAGVTKPTLYHYLPMIYALGLQRKGEELQFIHEGFQNGSVSMRAFQIG